MTDSPDIEKPIRDAEAWREFRWSFTRIGGYWSRRMTPLGLALAAQEARVEP